MKQKNDGIEYPVNYWYTLGYEYGYRDIFYTQQMKMVM